MPAPEVVEALAKRFGAASAALGVSLSPKVLLETMRALRDVHGYRHYVLGTAVDLEAVFEVIHAVRSEATSDTLFVRTAVPKETPGVDSIAFVYAGAEWHEREIFDLFGVNFHGHPDLRRLLMPDDYEGHPLRKSFAMDTPWGYRPATPSSPEASS